MHMLGMPMQNVRVRAARMSTYQRYLDSLGFSTIDNPYRSIDRVGARIINDCTIKWLCNRLDSIRLSLLLYTRVFYIKVATIWFAFRPLKIMRRQLYSPPSSFPKWAIIFYFTRKNSRLDKS